MDDCPRFGGGGKSGHHSPSRRGEAYGLTTRRGNTRGANRDAKVLKDWGVPQLRDEFHGNMKVKRPNPYWVQVRMDARAVEQLMAQRDNHRSRQSGGTESGL